MLFSNQQWLRYQRTSIVFALLFLFSAGKPYSIFAQQPSSSLFKVLTLTGEKQGAADLPQDHGATGTWQRLLKLKTIGSVLHTQAHPDDEHADLLTYLGRGKGVRTALLSLNRGESGANVLGAESFDHLGILRTQEFLLAASYYGLDDLYFTRLADYGFSKRVGEAYDLWGKQNVLREMVRVIRINRPLVVISRFHGSERDGHGNHQAAGELTPMAYELAGDSAVFPELLKEGLRPWKPLKLYRGGVRTANNEPWNIELNTGEYSPWLGQSYKNFSLLGYSMHRSQVGGNRNMVAGPSKIYYERLKSEVKSTDKESDFFDGIDTSIGGIFKLTGEKAPDGVMQILSQIATEVNNALHSFQLHYPVAVVPYLTNGLSKTRAAIRLLTDQSEALFLLRIKEQQFMDAIHTALGVNVQAIAMPIGAKDARSLFEPPPIMGPAVAGKPFQVKALLLNNSPFAIEQASIKLGTTGTWKISSEPPEKEMVTATGKKEQLFIVEVPEGAAYSQPYFSRASLQENEYQLHDKQYEFLPTSEAAMRVAASYLVNNELIEVERPVQARQANLPYGYNLYSLKVAPAIAVNLKPKLGVIPLNARQKRFTAQVEIVNHFDGAIKGELSLNVPAGWKVQPSTQAFSFTNAGEKAQLTMTVILPAITQKDYKIEAVAIANGKTYTTGYQMIDYRDLDQSLVYSPAMAIIKGIRVNLPSGLRIGYVMGVGDEVPAALRQLGATVHLLTAADLSAGQFNHLDAVIIGIRAYAVRKDLITYNQSLLAYSKSGGHLIVLYQSPEFVPGQMAPYAASLPGNAEEISEENAPVTILASSHSVLHYPNQITVKDFDNWVEQRGSKFFSEWDTAYVPIISSHDVGQKPQSGGWLMANYGKGYYTYFAYSLHRQLPYGVEGAYRILANLVAYGRKK